MPRPVSPCHHRRSAAGAAASLSPSSILRLSISTATAGHIPTASHTPIAAATAIPAVGRNAGGGSGVTNSTRAAAATVGPIEGVIFFEMPVKATSAEATKARGGVVGRTAAR